MRYQTRSVKGHDRAANHDFAAAEIHGARGLFVIMDGTSKPGSGQLAQGLAQGVIRAYLSNVAQGADDSSQNKFNNCSTVSWWICTVSYSQTRLAPPAI